jgi:endoglucanase
MHGSVTGLRRKAAYSVSAAAAMSMLLTGCFTSPGPGRSSARSRTAGAIGAPYWVNPDTSAARQVSTWEKEGRDTDAKLLERIAEQPVAEWIGPDNPEGQTRGFTEAATAAGRTAVIVLYNIPHRDCGQYSKGGASDGDTYRNWLDKVVAGIGDRPATVVLEPDALTHVVDGCTPDTFHEERYALLAYAIGKLKTQPHTEVYLDAGNSGWVTDPARMVAPLNRAGIGQADGFALNTSNFQTTRASAAYGIKLSELLGGKHFVIDTSRNGRGPLTGAHDEAWCNPPGRGLGHVPTTKTSNPLIDAYLWIKRPGDSDGTCKGGPKAGTWWPEYALGLARNASSS